MRHRYRGTLPASEGLLYRNVTVGADIAAEQVLADLSVIRFELRCRHASLNLATAHLRDYQHYIGR